jgi:hypothetical protein
LEVARRILEEQTWTKVGRRLRFLTPLTSQAEGKSKEHGSLDT